MRGDELRSGSAGHDPRTLSRREFVRRLSTTAAGGGLVAAAFAGCHLSPSQQAEAAEAMVDKLGKLPKVQLGRRMGNTVHLGGKFDRKFDGPVPTIMPVSVRILRLHLLDTAGNGTPTA